MSRIITRFFTLAAGIAVFAAVAGFGGTAAHATTVVCGYTTTGIPVPAAPATDTAPAHPAGTVNIGIIVQNRTEDSGYKKICDKINDGILTGIQKNPKLSVLKWTKHNNSPCHDFGSLFPPSNPPQAGKKAYHADVCDNIANHKGYQVESDFFPGPGGTKIIMTTYTEQSK